MLTDQDYENWAKKIGRRFRISGRVIRYVRSIYKDKYKDGISLEVFKSVQISELNDKISDIKRSNKPQILEIVNLLSADIKGLKRSEVVIKKTKKDLDNILGGIDKLGYRESSKWFIGRMTQAQFDEIIADIPDSKEVFGK